MGKHSPQINPNDEKAPTTMYRCGEMVAHATSHPTLGELMALAAEC